MNAVMIIPTGIRCEIGGHAGDATPAARLLAECVDLLIVHPNVVNASTNNEMTANMQYVEGSMLDRFLRDEFGLREVCSNRILVAVNKPVRPETVNAVSASRVTIGVDVQIMELDTPLKMTGMINQDGRAGGTYSGVDELCRQLREIDPEGKKFDALGIVSLIDVPRDVAKKYWHEGGVNPWGGIEAIVSRAIAEKILKPVAHAPIQQVEAKKEYANGEYEFVCNPCMAPEIISECFLHCILKGLHRAPRVHWHHRKGSGICVQDIDVMISPMCWGEPHEACEAKGIPVVYVRENTCVGSSAMKMRKGMIFVNNYIEAAGLLMSMQAGVTVSSVQRPIPPTEVL